MCISEWGFYLCFTTKGVIESPRLLLCVLAYAIFVFSADRLRGLRLWDVVGAAVVFEMTMGS